MRREVEVGDTLSVMVGDSSGAAKFRERESKSNVTIHSNVSRDTYWS